MRVLVIQTILAALVAGADRVNPWALTPGITAKDSTGAVKATGTVTVDYATNTDFSVDLKFNLAVSLPTGASFGTTSVASLQACTDVFDDGKGNSKSYCGKVSLAYATAKYTLNVVGSVGADKATAIAATTHCTKPFETAALTTAPTAGTTSGTCPLLVGSTDKTASG